MSVVKEQRARGKQRKDTGKRYSEEFLGFVDVDLKEGDRRQIQESIDAGVCDVADFILSCAREGYKFSLAADFEHESYIATVTGKASFCLNKGYALSGRGPDGYGAVVCLWYKVEVLFNWEQWAVNDTPGDHQPPLFR